MADTFTQTGQTPPSNSISDGSGHTFFEQPILQREVGDDLLQGTRLAAQIMHLGGRRGTGGVSPTSRRFPAYMNSFDQV